MSIQLYNTLTNRKEAFEPLNPPNVSIYLCGPTVYKPSHIGHAVGPIIFDAVKRYLTWRGFKVTWVVNITDVDDKLIAEAAAQNTTVPALAARIEQNYKESLAALYVTGIDQYPRASENMDAIIDVISRLIDKGAAYPADGDVYFDVTADDDYGKLSNRQREEQVGQRELQGGGKRNPADFALWKAAKPDEPDEVKYDSPWGKGRPGWHIECSAMSMKVLGDTMDIHAGGMDLIFPHHENEIAQSETCTHKTFARFWLHHGLTRFNTKKVSKSDPTMQEALTKMTLSNLLQEYTGELLRFFVLSTHYRRPIDFSPEELESKRKGLTSFHRLFERVAAITGQCPYGVEGDAPAFPSANEAIYLSEFQAACDEREKRYIGAMDDDFNTAAGLATLFDFASDLNRFIDTRKLESAPEDIDKQALLAGAVRLLRLGQTLGVFLEPPAKAGGDDATIGKVLDAHLAVRQACREAKNFAQADAIRDGLTAAGVTLEDKPGGTAWRIESAKPDADVLDRLVQLHIEVRKACRASKDFALADLIRDQLTAAGITLEDKPDGTRWSVA